jgi:(4S)-4-hydroxy-5-phosphonooxypentane-2,3-dione isomerase
MELVIYRERKMLIIQVFVHVIEEKISDFIAATRENAQCSLDEPGVARFDILQQKDDPARFVLVEVYYSDDDPARHKETEHYKLWRVTVADMMQDPRSSIIYDDIFPGEYGWEVKDRRGNGNSRRNNSTDRRASLEDRRDDI